MQQHKVGMAARGQAVALQAQQAGRVHGHRIKALAHGRLAGHLAHVQAHVRGLQHVGAAAAVPGVEHAVVAKGHRQARSHQLGHAGHAPALGVGVVAALQGDVDERVGHHAQVGLTHQRDELAHVVVVHAVHGGEVRARDAAVQAQALGFISQGFHMARVRIVAFVAVHVYALGQLRGQLAEDFYALGALCHGAFEVRNTAHHIHAHVQCPFQVVEPALAAQHAVLRKGHQLQVQVRCHALLHIQQGLHRQQAGVAGVHMAADGQQPARHGPVAVLQCALHDGVVRELGLELAPQRNAFEQGAAFIHTRLAVAQGRIHVEMRVHKRRAHQQAACVHCFMRWGLQAFGHFGDAAVLHGNRHVLAPVGQSGMGDEQVKHGMRGAGRVLLRIRCFCDLQRCCASVLGAGDMHLHCGCGGVCSS